jgi:hypothetical protein
MSEREDLERLLGTTLPAEELSVHGFTEPGLDYRVLYAAVPDAPKSVLAASGLATEEGGDLAATLLPSGWRPEPGDPPDWWPDVAALQNPLARLLSPSGWLLAGYHAGTLYVLATVSGDVD